MRKLLIILFILIFSQQSYSQDEKVYFARSVNSQSCRLSGFIIEDHLTFKQNEDKWGNDDLVNYENYTAYIRNILKKYASYSDTVYEYYITGWKDEFSKLTNLKPDERLVISTPDRIIDINITGYFIDLNEEIGGGVIFYPVAEYVPRYLLPHYDILICAPAVIQTKLVMKGISDTKITDKFKSKLLPLLKGVKYSEWENDKEILKDVKSIDTSELKIFKGNFSGKDNEYLVSYTKRLSFDTFASAILIMDENGRVILEPSKLVKSDFTYITALGTADYNNDGILEIIIESGYYEGRGYELWKYTKDGFITIASGFYFGV